ncbi:dienelactone hydrolase family protein [Stella sp.]|uniref:dienelactone hydrolase family protein n=1 Tax=Stella sp. TaxID=2912054 RepID=UPI0035B476AB
MGTRIVAGALVAAILGMFPAAASPVRTDLGDGATGRIAFLSRTPSGPSELMAGQGPETAIAGELRLPARAGPGRVPLMIVSHGSGGILAGREDAWAERLRGLGVATLVVDSFGPRGIRATAEDQGRLSTAASVADAFAALRIAATHPAIDAARIGVMGFSKGGQVALYTLLEPYRRGSGVGDLRFALHVALYASCSLPYRSERTTGAPVLLLLGGADDYTPAAHCARYAEWFRARGSDVRVEIFPGAHHGFDVPGPLRTLPRVQSARDCGLDIDLEPVPTGRRWADGAVVPNAAIGEYLRSCMRRGASFGGDPAALAGAVAAVRGAVLRVLRP